MHLSTWIVTYVTSTNPRAAVFFAIAGSSKRARELVSHKTGIGPKSLSVVQLSQELSPVPQELRGRPGLERYLGPLDQFSPFLRDACDFCRGTGKLIGSRPVQACPTCGGTGAKKKR